MRKVILYTIIISQAALLWVGFKQIDLAKQEIERLDKINATLKTPQPCVFDNQTSASRITIQVDDSRHISGVCVGGCK